MCVCVCVCVCVYIYILETKWTMNNLLQVPENPGSGCQHGRVLVRALFQVADCGPLTVLHVLKGQRSSLRFLS